MSDICRGAVIWFPLRCGAEKSHLSLQTLTEWDCMHLINNLFPEGVVMAEDIKKQKTKTTPPPPQ